MTTTARSVFPKHSLFETEFGRAYLEDSLQVLERIRDGSVDLIVTSPPFGLLRQKEYGNEQAGRYVEWFRPFGALFKKILKESGSLVIDIGGAWKAGEPTRSLYHFKLLISLCEEFGFHLAQEFYWWNPSKLPTPAEWVNVRRVRVKDAVNSIYWLSSTPWPKASNRRVLQPYSDSMRHLLNNGYRAKMRPSGHDISSKFSRNNGASIPPNLIAAANTESNSAYLRYCQSKGIKPHPARFPSVIPEYFIRMLTDVNDVVVDPFGGSCVTGEVCERLRRRWICAEIVPEYLEGARGRFTGAAISESKKKAHSSGIGESDGSYRVLRPDSLWNGIPTPPLETHGGRVRPPREPYTEPPVQETRPKKEKPLPSGQINLDFPSARPRTHRSSRS